MVDLAEGDGKRETATWPREAAFVVFAQRADARIDIAGWSAHAERFFSTRLGLAEDRTVRSGARRTPARRGALRHRPGGGGAGIRSASARPRVDDDLALAVDADGRIGPGGTGLALVARRCQTVWLVVRETDADPLALRLAAILASVLLGPILDVRVPELFGVKTARAKLDALLAR